MKYGVLGFGLLLMLHFGLISNASAEWAKLSAEERVSHVRIRREALLNQELKAQGLKLGCQAFIRIFKEERELELWLKPAKSNPWIKFQAWPIAAMSGKLGPKEREGDLQAPEGCYTVTARQMNPLSRYHLSFNIGYPNKVDLAHGRTGSLIMVHGNEVSIGCFAMTDPVIEDIYLILLEAFQAGQGTVAVHSFPFRMTKERMLFAQSSPWYSFWQDLLPIYAAFERQQQPPKVSFRAGGKHYHCE